MEWIRIAIHGMDFPSFYHVYGTGLDLQENEIFIGGYSDYNQGYTRGFVDHYTCEEIPGCNEMVYPENGQTGVETDLNLSWINSDRASGSMIFAGSCPDCTDLIDSLDVGQTNEYLLEDLPYNDTIFMKIVPYNTSGLAQDCQSVWFTTEDYPAPPECVSLLSPVHGSTAVSVYSDLYWEKKPDATGYQITVGTCSGCNNILDSLMVGDVDIVDPGVLPGNDTIYVHIVAFNDGGMALDCEESFFITMNDRIASNICSYDDGERILSVVSEQHAKFGSAIDLSEDHMVVSSPGLGAKGAATFFQRQGSIWRELNTVFPENGLTFGTDVAVDGDYAVVTDEEDWTNGIYAGSAHVFRKNENGWEKTQKLLADDGRSADYFGKAVDLFGNYMVVGCPGDDTIWHSGGSAYIFRLEDNLWIQDTILCPSDLGVNDYFGSSVAIHGDFMIISATWHYTNGAAYIYKRTGKKWNLHQKLTPGNFSANQHFGTSVAISGRFAVVTSPSLFVGYNKGEIFIYELMGDQWVMTEGYVLTSDQSSLNWAKSAAAISGEQFVIGGENAFYLFQYDGSWKETKKISPAGIKKEDGFSQALGMENGVIVVGAANSNGQFEDSGAIYSYNCNTPDCAALLYPLPNSINTPLNPLLKWNQAFGTSGVELSLGTCPGCDDLLKKTDIRGRNNFEMPFNLPQNTVIHVTLRPYNMAGIPLECQRDSFRTMTITTPLDCPQLIFPAENELISLLSYVRWKPVDNAKGYRIDLGSCEFCSDLGSIMTTAFDSEYIDIDTSGLQVFITITAYDENHFGLQCASSRFYLNEHPYRDSSVIRSFEFFPVERSYNGGGDPELSINGPYCPGEIVTFLGRFQFESKNCQKLHGIIPKLGNGWDHEYLFSANDFLQLNSGKSFFPFQNILNTADLTDLCVFTTADGSLQMCNKLYEPDCPCNSGLTEGTLLPPGWFISNPIASCNFEQHPNKGIGLTQNCNTIKNYSFLFKLKVKDPSDLSTCEEAGDLNYTFYLFTDAETGCDTSDMQSRIFPIPGYHQINCDTSLCNVVSTGSVETKHPVTEKSHLLACFPNPATDLLNLDFYLADPVMVQFEMISSEGRVVKRITDDQMTSGEHRIQLAVDDLPSGMYSIIFRDHQQGILDSERIVIFGN